MGGLLDGINVMAQLVEQEGCSWEEARERWQQSEKAGHAPNIIHEKVAAQMGCSPEQARNHMEAMDAMALATFHVGNELSREDLH